MRVAAGILEEQATPGFVVGVRTRGGGYSTAAVGVADLQTLRPMSADGPFYLGSISKVFTATVVLQLAEAGILALDQPLQDFLPGFPNASEITIRHLLDHTSGLADVAIWIYFRPDREEMIRLVNREWQTDELVAKAAELAPDFAPGESWAYSNTNYTLLAAVVEKVSGRTLAETIRLGILTPLRLEHTWLDQYEEPRGQLGATGYLGPLRFWPHSEMFGELGPTTVIDKGNMEWGSGGMVSTVEDATRFLDALVHGDLVSQEYLDTMLDWLPTPPLGAPGSETPVDLESGYGLGLARGVRDGYEMIGHGGLYNGHTTGLWYVTECSAVVSFYANRGFVDARAIMDDLVAAMECSDLE